MKTRHNGVTNDYVEPFPGVNFTNNNNNKIFKDCNFLSDDEYHFMLNNFYTPFISNHVIHSKKSMNPFTSLYNHISYPPPMQWATSFEIRTPHNPCERLS